MCSKSIGDVLRTRQLRGEDELSDSQYCDIAKLIYDTDGFIFPALFTGCEDPRKTAERVFSLALKTGTDHLFNKDNVFVCFDNEKIVGMILWYCGAMEWNYEELIQLASEAGANLKHEIVENINNSFFEDDKEMNPSDTITLSYVSVCNSMRGRGIGSFMLNNFIASHEKSAMELCVLKDNKAAIKLYENKGFIIESEYNGYSQTPIKPVCYRMHKTLK